MAKVIVPAVQNTSFHVTTVSFEVWILFSILHAELKRSVDTLLTLVSPTGEKTEYDLHIERSTLEATKRG